VRRLAAPRLLGRVAPAPSVEPATVSPRLGDVLRALARDTHPRMRRHSRSTANLVNTPIVPVLLFLASSALVVSSCDSRAAHAAQEHAPPSAELEPVSVTVHGERALLFMEHEPLVQGASSRFLVHLSVVATGEPVRSGRVSLAIGSTTFVADAPKRDGLFVPEGSVPSAGRFPARLVVASPQVEETLELGELTVHASADAARAAASGSGAEPTAGVPFLMEQQWRVKLLLERAGARTLTRRLIVPAQVRTPEGAEAAVSSPIGGRLLARPGAALPRTGDAVDAGQVLAEVEPPLGAAEIAQLQALRLELDLKALDIVRALSEAQARVDFAQRERERIAKLREHGLSTQQALDEAERDLHIARSALDGATATKRSLDEIVEQRGPRASGASALAVRLPVAAPLRGTVVAAAQLHGASVEPGQELFRILDTSSVWIEARVSEFDLHLVNDAPSAAATFAALPGVRLDVGGADPARALRLLPLLDASSRTARIRCSVPNEAGALKDGMLAELEIATERVDAEVVIPLEAIVAEQSLPTAYVMLEGELFQKRDLELGVKDGAYVEVLRGIEPGEYVATRGAYVVKLAALTPTSFGAGHQH
jgi:RND family efflux transporter MFP subunit